LAGVGWLRHSSKITGNLLPEKNNDSPPLGMAANSRLRLRAGSYVTRKKLLVTGCGKKARALFHTTLASVGVADFRKSAETISAAGALWPETPPASVIFARQRNESCVGRHRLM
jgi:hypothetical protein